MKIRSFVCAVRTAYIAVQRRGFSPRRRVIGPVLACGALLVVSGPAPAAEQIAPKPATQITADRNAAVYQQLDFSDQRDFQDAQRGFIATLEAPGVISNDIPELNDLGYFAWDIGGYDFLNGPAVAPPSANPSLWRHEQLNNFNGLFEVISGAIYQVRSFDLATMTFVRSRNGWIVIDPLMTRETARAGLALFRQHVSSDPVTAIIVTHSHADHFGGIGGILEGEGGKTIARDARGGKKDAGIVLYAPEGFYSEAISENLYVGNVMQRRAAYMYGKYLAKNEFRSIGMGLGKTMGFGMSGTFAPTTEVPQSGPLTIDKLTVQIQMAPGSEAPAEMHLFFPDYGAFCPGENVNHTMHNLLTPRGAKVRDPKAWAQYIDEAIDRFGPQIQVMIGTHHWPVWDNARCLELLEKQRDMYRFFNDQVIRMLNTGMNMEEIAEAFELPVTLDREFYNRGYYGTKNHNVKAVVQRYIGWWDGNPANYFKYPEEDAARRYVEFMGGESAAIEKARASYEKGDYRWVAEVLKHVVFANPENTEAKQLQADAFEQLGYSFEAGTWRCIFLSAAEELRNGSFPHVSNQDVQSTIAQMPPTLIFEFLSTLLLGKQAEALNYNMRFIFTDPELPATEQNLYVSLKNGVLHCKSNKPNLSTSATYTLTKARLAKLIVNPIDLTDVQVQGDQYMFAKLCKQFGKFPNPAWNVVLPLWYDNRRQ